MTWRRTSACYAIAAWALCSGCKNDPSTRPCGDEDPAYLLTVRSAVDEPLPDDTTVIVYYGGVNTESYSLERPGKPGKVMFCGPDGSDPDGAGGNGGEGGMNPKPSGPTTLVCELYILGSVTVEVTGGSFEGVEVSLAPESDDCGPLTVEEEVVLGSEVVEE